MDGKAGRTKRVDDKSNRSGPDLPPSSEKMPEASTRAELPPDDARKRSRTNDEFPPAQESLLPDKQALLITTDSNGKTAGAA